LYLGERLFDRQLSEPKQAGFRTMGKLVGGKDVNPEKVIGLTFDDGFSSTLRYGAERLSRHDFCAIQFLVADRLGGVNEWDLSVGEAPESLMDESQVREWISAGHQIGSHSLTHPFLTRISPTHVREEIVGSKKKLEDMFGFPIHDFCYPYGDWNAAVRDAVIEAGYQSACTTEYGVNRGAADRFSLKRITARYASRSLKNFAARVRGLMSSD
jgi:peptidoglycan/xylan/chitin deacetylase (PgdA/CDA1 family)